MFYKKIHLEIFLFFGMMAEHGVSLRNLTTLFFVDLIKKLSSCHVILERCWAQLLF